jgi:hypothetical protein
MLMFKDDLLGTEKICFEVLYEHRVSVTEKIYEKYVVVFQHRTLLSSV